MVAHSNSDLGTCGSDDLSAAGGVAAVVHDFHQVALKQRIVHFLQADVLACVVQVTGKQRLLTLEFQRKDDGTVIGGGSGGGGSGIQHIHGHFAELRLITSQHGDVYTALNDVIKEYPNAKVFSDIGCYTLGALPPFRTISSCVDMGASITMAKGAADSGLFPAIAVIGDSTFTHSGMTGLLDAINSKASITVVISDNLTTGMTGGQDSAGTGRIESICLGLGVEPEHLRVMLPIPKNHEELCNIIREEIEYKGVSVIIPRRECIQVMNRKLKQKRANKA